MRIDLFLKKSRIIKRRTKSKELIDNQLVMVNNKIVKPSYMVSINDIITINMYNKIVNYKILDFNIEPMYTLISEERKIINNG